MTKKYKVILVFVHTQEYEVLAENKEVAVKLAKADLGFNYLISRDIDLTRVEVIEE